MLTIGNSHAVDVYQADKLFNEQKYAEAFAEYKKSAEIGNPHAYFRLGEMYAKGLGIEKDTTNSLLHFYSAAEFNNKQAEKVLSKILHSYSVAERENIQNLLKTLYLEKGYDNTQRNMYPKFVAVEPDQNQTPEKIKAFTKSTLVPSIRLNADVYPDGSMRNELDAFTFFDSGFKLNRQRQMYRGSIANKEEVAAKLDEKNLTPKFNQPLFYFSALVGSSVSRLKDESKDLFRQEWHKLRALLAPSMNQQFQLAMLTIHHRWMFLNDELKFEDDKKEKEYKALVESSRAKIELLAKQNYLPAMFELGVSKFSDRYYLNHVPKQVVDNKRVGLDYIVKAARYNFAPAEFRLGMMFLASPWVEKNEQKARFWFQSAAEKGLQPAILRLAELLLTAEDNSLHDVAKATRLLEQFTNKADPEYFYLLALTYKDQSKPQWRKFFDNLSRAILAGTRHSWDVSEWQALYNHHMKGSITISDKDA